MTMRQLPLAVGLRERAQFETYWNPRATLAVQSLRAAADGHAGVRWIWGSRGVGRSHLLQAVCHAAPVARGAAYVPLTDLGQATAERLQGLGRLNVVCLDDLERAAGVPAFDAALFSLHREIEEHGGALVVAADRAPSGVPWSLPDIGSRFAAAEVFQIPELDEEGQRHALELRAAQRGLELPEETSRYLQRRFRRDLRTLCQLLDTLDVAALSAQRRLTVPFIREVLGS